MRKFVLRCLVLILIPLGPVIASEEGPFIFSSDVEVGYGYDTNVAVDDVDLNTSRGDQFADLSLSGRLKYEAENDSSLSASISLSEKLYDTFDRFDGRLLIASVTGEKELSAATLGLSLRYIDYQLDNEGFLDLVQISPTVSWFPSKKSYVRLAYEFNDESFESSKGRENRQHKIGATGYYFINGLRKYVTLRFQAAKEDADDELFNNDAAEVRITYHQKMTVWSRTATLELSYRYQERDYDESIHPAIGDFREDRRHRLKFEFELPIRDSLSIVSEIFVNDYRSNLASADYDQRVYQLTLKYKL